MDLDQYIWINKISTISNCMVNWQVSDWCKSAKCQNKRPIWKTSQFNSCDSLRPLSKEVRHATFLRDGVPQNGAHRFWGREKCKPNKLKMVHPPTRIGRRGRSNCPPLPPLRLLVRLPGYQPPNPPPTGQLQIYFFFYGASSQRGLGSPHSRGF